MYLVAILDWYSRYVVSWELDQTMQIAFVMEVMQRALSQAVSQICNSDQGSQFTSPQYTQLLHSHDVRISMDSKGRALDNIFTERLWRTVKYEEVYLKDYTSPREAREGLRDHLRFYNEQRIHQALDYQTPAEVYFARRLGSSNTSAGRRGVLATPQTSGATPKQGVQSAGSSFLEWNRKENQAMASFDPIQYKQTTQEQWQAAAAAWNQWKPTLEQWLGPRPS